MAVPSLRAELSYTAIVIAAITTAITGSDDSVVQSPISAALPPSVHRNLREVSDQRGEPDDACRDLLSIDGLQNSEPINRHRGRGESVTKQRRGRAYVRASRLKPRACSAVKQPI
jgi:hypothetical protein